MAPSSFPTRRSPLDLGLAALIVTLGASATARADCVDGRPLNIGHRGTGNTSASNPYPENTIPSFIAAGEEGATMVELDVQLSADGIPVLMHDATVDLTTDGMGCVTELTLDELKALDAGVGSPMEGMGVQIPTLEEVLAATELDLNVELKIGGEGCPEPGFPEVATAVLDVLAADPTPRLQTISSFELGLLDEVRAQDDAIYIGFLAATPFSAMAAADAGFDALNLIDGSVDDAAVTMVRDLGLEVNVWTVDDPARLTELLVLDVDGIITNEPPALEMARAAQCPTGDDTGDSGDATGDGTDETGAPGGTAAASTDDGGGSSDDEGSGTGGSLDDDDDTEGCGCRTRAPSRGGALALLLVLARARRRRRS